MKGPGSVEHGVKWLSELNEILIDPRECPLAAREYINYALAVNKSGEVISKYPDKDNHSIDSSRYALSDEIRAKPKKKLFDQLAVPILSRWS